MASTIAKAVLCALAAAGTAQAAPQVFGTAVSSGIPTSMVPQVIGTAVSTGTPITIPCESTTSKTASSTSTSTSRAVPPPPAPVDNSALFRDLFTAPTAIKRFQRLLTAAGEKLLSAEELRKLVVFDFNGATPAPGAKGGATKAGKFFTSSVILV